MSTDTKAHVLDLTETNGRGYVPMCSCGWVGAVHSTPVTTGASGNRRVFHPEKAQEAARAEHRCHVRDAP